MRRIAIVVLFVVTASVALESCASKVCPAYNSYPKARRSGG